jgi:mannose-6-phosphate isomerase-like protein (cupin superfamily)
MKFLLALMAVAVLTVVVDAQSPQTAAPKTPPAATPAPTPVTKVMFFDHATVAGVLAKGGPLVTAPDLIVQGSHRDVAGQVEVHDKETDVLYIVDGAATFVTGGKMVGGKVSRPGQWLGTDITGGETRQLTKGDVIVIPAGTPHWFKQVSPNISYFVVKGVKP